MVATVKGKLSTKETAESLGFSESRLREKAREEGFLKAVQTGTRWSFDEVEVKRAKAGLGDRQEQVSSTISRSGRSLTQRAGPLIWSLSCLPCRMSWPQVSDCLTPSRESPAYSHKAEGQNGCWQSFA